MPLLPLQLRQATQDERFIIPFVVSGAEGAVSNHIYIQPT
jgi:hypothetical protein